MLVEGVFAAAIAEVAVPLVPIGAIELLAEEELDAPPSSLLMEISCCRLLTPTNCWMYAFGSVGWVGS